MPHKALLETYPLYKKLHCKLPETMEHIAKPPISFSCPTCKSMQTYVMTNEYYTEFGYVDSPLSARIVRATYCCVGCRSHYRDFFIKFDGDFLEQKGWMMKVGQFPPWGIAGDPVIEKMLGSHKDHLERGLICESQGYGIGAFSYYRRIAEEIIDELIGDIGEIIPASDREHFEAAFEKVKNTRQTAEKISLIKDLLPLSLEIEGMNPLGVIYRSLSEGLHSNSDEECLDYAEAVRESLVFLASQVSETKSRRRIFTEKMKHLLASKSD